MNRNAVIIDDDFITRMDVRHILEANGYKIVGEAEDGLDAVEICKKYNPELVIMDIDMPILDGIKTSKILTKGNLVGGIILLTGHEDMEYIRKAQDVGAYGYLVKPINDKVFIPTVEMCLSKVDEFKKIKKDLDRVNTKLNERKLIEKAKGFLIRELRISEDEAYNTIRKLSMDKRTTMCEIANMFIIAYEGWLYDLWTL